MKKNDYKEKTSDESSSADNFAEDMSGNYHEMDTDLLEVTETEDNADNLSGKDTEDKYAKLNDSYLRLMAEYDNYRKRTLKEKSDLIKNGGEKVLSGLLPIIDDFQRAQETIDKSNDIEAVKEGVDLIYAKFMTFLQQNGVKLINAMNKDFDDELSEAVAIVPAPTEGQKGKVIDIVQSGYTLNDKVLRHAKVVVAN